MDVSIDQGDLQTEKDLWTAALVILLTSSDPPLKDPRDRGDADFIRSWAALGTKHSRGKRAKTLGL